MPRAAARLWLLAGALLWASPSRAQQVLYTPPPPRGSAQIRLVNTTPSELAVQSGYTATTLLGTQDATRVGAYVVVPAVAGKTFSLSAAVAGQTSTTSFTVPPHAQVSVLLQTGTAGALRAVPVVDEVEFNQLRSRLRFYNATPSCAAAGLVLRQGGQAVFADVPAGATRMRAVNPVTADVIATCDKAPGPALKLENLEVGRGYSVWLMAPGGKIVAFLSPDGNSLVQP